MQLRATNATIKQSMQLKFPENVTTYLGYEALHKCNRCIQAFMFQHSCMCCCILHCNNFIATTALKQLHCSNYTATIELQKNAKQQLHCNNCNNICKNTCWKAPTSLGCVICSTAVYVVSILETKCSYDSNATVHSGKMTDDHRALLMRTLHKNISMFLI